MSEMELSEAIRLGAMVTRQVFGAYCELGVDERIDGTCALGGAIYAKGGGTVLRELEMMNGQKFLDGIAALFPILETDTHILPHIWFCPACRRVDDRLGALIVHLNDTHQWTRQSIADFIEMVEHLETQAIEPVGVLAHVG